MYIYFINTQQLESDAPPCIQFSYFVVYYMIFYNVIYGNPSLMSTKPIRQDIIQVVQSMNLRITMVISYKL